MSELVTLLELLQTVGTPVGLLIVFLWWSYHRDERMQRHQVERENRLVERIEKMEDWQREELTTLVKENTIAFHRFAKAIETSMNTKGESIFGNGLDNG